MLLLATGVIASVLYVAATVLQIQTMLGKRDPSPAFRILSGLAVLCHGVAVIVDFNETTGFDLGIYPMLSLMALSIAAIVLISSIRRPVDNLFVIIFPIATVTLLLEMFLQGDYTPREDITGGIASHILLSIVAYSLITIAAVQALLLSFGDSQLKHHHLSVLQNMPPLETMEQLMFEMLWFGLLFLTLSIISGFLFLEDISGPGLIHHTVITLSAWVVFTVLLWGRYQLGWRGAVASRWTLSGFVLLALGYFGSKVVIEIILGRA